MEEWMGSLVEKVEAKRKFVEEVKSPIIKKLEELAALVQEQIKWLNEQIYGEEILTLEKDDDFTLTVTNLISGKTSCISSNLMKSELLLKEPDYGEFSYEIILYPNGTIAIAYGNEIKSNLTIAQEMIEPLIKENFHLS